MSVPRDVAKAAEVLVSFDNHIATVAAVATIGTTARNVSLTTEARTAVASVSGSTKNNNLIDKHGSGI
jgi:hypothetical protein